MEICDLPNNFKFITIKNVYLYKNSWKDFNRKRMSGEGLVLLALETINPLLSQNHKESHHYFPAQGLSGGTLPPFSFHRPTSGPRDKGSLYYTASFLNCKEGCSCVLIMKVFLWGGPPLLLLSRRAAEIGCSSHAGDCRCFQMMIWTTFWQCSGGKFLHVLRNVSALVKPWWWGLKFSNMKYFPMKICRLG